MVAARRGGELPGRVVAAAGRGGERGGSRKRRGARRGGAGAWEAARQMSDGAVDVGRRLGGRAMEWLNRTQAMVDAKH